MPVNAFAAFDKAGRVDLDALADAALIAERSRHLVGTARGISSADASSAYQIIPDTFNAIKKRRPDLPDIEHADLNDPANEAAAREYSKAVFADIVNRGHTDPLEIASLYNSGKPWSKGKRLKETRDYAPRFARAFNSKEPVEPAESAPPRDDRTLLEKVVSPFAPSEAQAAEPTPGVDAFGAFNEAPEGVDAFAAFGEADDKPPERFATNEADQILGVIEQSDLPRPIKDALISSPNLTGIAASMLDSGAGRQAITLGRSVSQITGQRPQDERISAQTAIADSALGRLLGVQPNVAADERLRGPEGGQGPQDILGTLDAPGGTLEDFISLGVANREFRSNLPSMLAGGGLGIGGDVLAAFQGPARTIPGNGIARRTTIGGAKGVTRPDATDESIRGEAIGTGVGFGVAGGLGKLSTALFPTSVVPRVAFPAAVFGGVTAAEGGSPSQIAASATLAGILGLESRPGLKGLSTPKRVMKVFDPFESIRFGDDFVQASREAFKDIQAEEVSRNHPFGQDPNAELPFTVPEAYARTRRAINRPENGAPESFATPKIIAILKSPEFQDGHREIELDSLEAAESLIRAQSNFPIGGLSEADVTTVAGDQSLTGVRQAMDPFAGIGGLAQERHVPFVDAIDGMKGLSGPEPGVPQGPRGAPYEIEFFHEFVDPIMGTTQRVPGLPDPSAFGPALPVPDVNVPFTRADIEAHVPAIVNEKGQFVNTSGKPLKNQHQADLVDLYKRLDSIAETRLARGEDPFGPVSENELAMTRNALDRAVNLGLLPEEARANAIEGMKGVGVTDARRLVADVLMANGGTVVPSRSGIDGAVLPPAGEAAVEAFSKADLTTFIDRWGPDYILRYRAPQVMMRSSPFHERAQDLVTTVAEPARRLKLIEWEEGFHEILSEPAPVIGKLFPEGLRLPRIGARAAQRGDAATMQFRRRLPEADLEAVGKMMHRLDLREEVPEVSRAEVRRLMETRPDLVEKVSRLRLLFDDAAKLNLLGERYEPNYFAVMVRHGDFVGELPKAIGETLPEVILRDVNTRLTAEAVNMSRADFGVVRDFLTRRPGGDANIQKPQNLHLIPRAERISAVLREVSAVSKRDLPTLTRDYLNFMQKTSTDAGLVKNQSVEILGRVPEDAFFRHIDKDRTEFNPELMNFNAWHVSDVYFRGAARRFAYNAVLPEVRALSKAFTDQHGNNHPLSRYFVEWIDNSLGRRADKFGQRLATAFSKRDTVKALAASDIKLARSVAAKLTRPDTFRRAIGTVRSAQAVAKLGWNFFFGFINTLQPYTFALAKLGAPLDGRSMTLKSFPVDVLLTPARYARGLFWLKKGWISAFSNRGIHREINEAMVVDGILDKAPKFEIDTSFMGDMSRKSFDAMNFVLLSTTWWNRVITYSAGYQRALSELMPRVNAGEMDIAQAKLRARAFAKFLASEGGEFSGGAQATPIGLQTPLGGLIGQFKSFTVQTLETLVGRMSGQERLVFVAAVLAITGPRGFPLMSQVDPKNKWWPSLARALNIDFSSSIGWSMLGLPMATRDFKSAVLGPSGGLGFDVAVSGGKAINVNQIPALKRVLKGRTTKEKILGERDL